MNNKLISIIIPCYNEAGNINNLINELNSHLDFEKYDYEYLFVNDGSKDETYDQIVANLENKCVKLIDFSRNFGKEAAMLAGLDYAIGDCGIIIDADLEMPVSKILEMIEYWENGKKLVLTYRSNRLTSFKAKLAAKYYDVYNYMTKEKILKDALDFQLMDREVINTICSIRERNRFLKGITGYIGYDYAIVPVEMGVRSEGKSNFATFNKLFSYAFASLAIHSNFVLKLAMKIGINVSIFSFIYLIYVIVSTLLFGNEVNGYASMMSVMLFMFGIVLSFLGVIGYYIGLIYDEIKERPNYIVSEFLGDRNDK